TLATLLLRPADSQAAGRRPAGVHPAARGAGHAHPWSAGHTARRVAAGGPFAWSRLLEALPAQPAYPADQRSRTAAVKPSPSGPSAASRAAVGLTGAVRRSYAVARWVRRSGLITAALERARRSLRRAEIGLHVGDAGALLGGLCD